MYGYRVPWLHVPVHNPRGEAPGRSTVLAALFALRRFLHRYALDIDDDRLGK